MSTTTIRLPQKLDRQARDYVALYRDIAGLVFVLAIHGQKEVGY